MKNPKKTNRLPASAAPIRQDSARYLLRLYVTSTMPSSARAIVNTRRICDEHLSGRYDLEIIDIAQHPARAAREQIIAAPTLIKILPLPEQRFIGDMSQTERFLHGLNLHTTPTGNKQP